MSFSYPHALTYLFGLQSRGVRLGLDAMNAALTLRGEPHKGLRYIHVGGTNGKGSVSATLASMLQKAGYRTGLYTSPHLHRFVERIQVNSRPISEKEVAQRVKNIRANFSRESAPRLSFFETTTLLAFEYFRDLKCDVVVLEVGLGGRLDATNVIVPEVSVITRIALEHEKILGGTVEKIAFEKAGILKPGIPAVIGVRDPKSFRVISEQAHCVSAPLYRIGRHFGVRGVRASRLDFWSDHEEWKGIKLPLLGSHQHDNIACALETAAILRARAWDVPMRAIRDGLSHVKWPGRLERIGGAPPVFLDAAHNPDGCKALALFLKTLPAKTLRRSVLVFGAMEDKDHRRMLSTLDKVVEQRIYVTAPTTRGAPATTFLRYRPGECADTMCDALRRARKAAGPTGIVVVAGSVFVVGEARALLKRIAHEPAIPM